MLDENKNNFQLDSESFNLKKFISTYTKQWKWFFLSLLITIGLSYLYIRYTVPEYVASAKVMLIDETKAAASPSAVFKDLSIFADAETAKVEDEIQVLKSRKLLTTVVENLNLNIQYFSIGRIYDTELYKDIPIEINFLAADSIVKTTNFSFYIEILSKLNFNYRVNEKDLPKKRAFGENIASTFGGMIITPGNNNIENYIGKTIQVKIKSVNSVAQYYKNKIEIFPIGKSSKILGISLEDHVIPKAKDIINESIKEYIKISVEDKRAKSESTAEFINSRIDLIATDLSEVDDNAERFKTGNKLTNITSESDLYLNSSAQMEQQLASGKTELSVMNFLKDQIEDGGDTKFKPIPSNVGLSDGNISSVAAKYNELLSVREERLKSSNEKHPIIVNLDKQLNNLKGSLKQSLNSSSKTLGIRVSSLQNQYDRINSKIYAVPGQTRELRDIEREQGTKEALYLYLLQKREEAAISLAATTPRATIVENAHSFGNAISPNKKLIYMAALFIGLFFPFSIIYIKNLLDTKIHNKEDLEQIIKDITVLGEIPNTKDKNSKLLVEKNDRSILSESFRIVRTNMDYVRRGRNVRKYDNVVFVTSTINGEGKSFFSLNMTLTIANAGKKVLLIGADIRNPQIFSAIKKKNVKAEISKAEVGLTEYLADKSTSIEETINTYNINDINIDILLSGKIPPNPAELLMSDRMKSLFDTVSSEYDYVIVDTAPSMLVTDTLLISEYSGHTVYLTRAEYTEKQILNYAKELHADKKLNGMMLVVNDVKESNFGYGAKYGYYGAPKKKGFFKRKT